ncbi:MAG: hypothetical protein IJS58_01855 [Bacilli bacterium]|nr:hypothetical protein [Bacilli bacterium]
MPKEDAVWLTKEQMSILFNRDRSASVHFLHRSDADYEYPKAGITRN